MINGTKTNFGSSPHDSGKTTEHERRDRIRAAEGAVLLLIEAAGPILVLGLALLSALVRLGG
jgi:hypothetical protein